MKEKSSKKKRIRKTLPIIITTTILGWFVPALFKITGISFVDKMLWKILFSVALNLATVIVSLCFTLGIVKDKDEGEKTRVAIYLFVVIVFCCLLATVLSFIERISPIVIIIVIVALICAIIVLSVKFCKKFESRNTKNDFLKNSGEERSIVSIINDKDKERVVAELNTLFDIWKQHGKHGENLFVANIERPDIKWIRLNKKPFNDGKLYALVQFNNSSKPIQQEVFFAEKRIWYKI